MLVGDVVVLQEPRLGAKGSLLAGAPTDNVEVRPLGPINIQQGGNLNVETVESLMCAVLRGEHPAWPDADDAGLVDAFLNRSEYHGVQALLHEHLHDASGWPPALLGALHRQAIAGTMWELRHQQVVAEMLATLAQIGIEPVRFEGTVLAYSLYPNPALRTRGDTDLIVATEERTRVTDALAGLGFAHTLELGELMSYQACLTREVVGGGEHTVDLHWKINNSELLSRLFSYDELRRAAVPLPGLSPHALGAGPVHALLIACMHRAGHKQAPYYVDGVAHYSGDRLIWLYDIHLLALALSPVQWTEFLGLAGQKGLRAVCMEGISQTQRCFSTPVPQDVMVGLAQPGPLEPAAEYLNALHLRRRWLDLCAHDGLGTKLRFVRELVFPPAAYMRDRFPDASLKWLPWLYVLRTLGGLRRRREGH